MTTLERMPTQPRPAQRVRSLAIAMCIALSGCATHSLTQAPASPSAPWQPGHADATSSASKPNALDTGTEFTIPAIHEASILPPAPIIDSEQPYSLPALIDIAQRENPDTRLAWNRARQAALAIGVAEATFLPMLSANVISGWQKTHTPLPLLPGDRSIDTELHGVVPALALEWLIFDFGQRRAIVEGIQHMSYAANVLFNGTHQKIIHDVTEAYYQYGAARYQVSIATQALKNSHQVADAVKQRHNAGLATVVETALASQQVAQAKLRRVNSEGVEQISYQAVLRAVGLPPSTRITISNPPEHALPDSNSAVTDEAIQMALSQRPDVLASYAAMKAATAGIAAAEAEFMPKVYLGAVAAHNRTDFQVRGLPNIRQQTGSTSVLLGVTIPLFDGGLRSARLRDAQIEAAKTSDTFQKIQMDAMREIIAQSNLLRTALASHQAASELVKTAETTYDAALEAYGHGVGTLTAVTIAVTALLDAQQAHMDARTVSQTAAANLAFVMGAMTSSRESWINAL
ncbi:TolC family protein [Alcaligenaceae bacterium]|nr:TolC family protein [Alcaligenaceae bacterium]